MFPEGEEDHADRIFGKRKRESSHPNLKCRYQEFHRKNISKFDEKGQQCLKVAMLMEAAKENVRTYFGNAFNGIRRSAEKEIRYCYGNQWMYAKKENGKFGILTEALDCTIRRNDKLSEGIVEIVVCDHHEEEIKEESVRILTVSLI